MLHSEIKVGQKYLCKIFCISPQGSKRQACTIMEVGETLVKVADSFGEIRFVYAADVIEPWAAPKAVRREWVEMNVHKSMVQVDDNIRDEDGHWITLGPKDFGKDALFGRTIRGDSYMGGHKLVHIRRLVEVSVTFED